MNDKRIQGLSLAVGMLLSSGASALSFNFGPESELSVDLDTTIRYSAGWRVADQNDRLLADPNADDGNRNFDVGLMQNRVDLVSEADIQYGDHGFFIRGQAYYDDIYQKGNDHDSPATSNNQSVAYNRFTDATRKQMGKDAELLDAFFYTYMNIGGREVSFRVGKQVVSWGESLFLQGGIASATSPLDASKSNVPGVELKEVFLPVGQAYGQLSLTDSLSIEAYYQWEWQKNRLNAAGSYFSTNDLIDKGGEALLTGSGPVPRGVDDEADDNGQWGLAVRYMSDFLNSAEFGFYHLNYHEKNPQFILDTSAPSYYLQYVEDIQLTGFSVGTVFGGANVSGEVSYRKDVPLGTPAGFELGETAQAQVSVVHIVPATRFMDNLTIMGEVGVNQVLGMDSQDLANDKSAWGYSIKFTPEYFGVAPGLDVAVPISFSQGVNGKSSVPGTFSEGNRKLGVGANFSYVGQYQFGLAYTAFLGQVKNNALHDRDYISLNAKYNF